MRWIRNKIRAETQRLAQNRRPANRVQPTAHSWLADRAAVEGITALEVLLNPTRMLWARAHEGGSPNLELTKDACVIANQAARYCHLRLAAVAHGLMS